MDVTRVHGRTVVQPPLPGRAAAQGQWRDGKSLAQKVDVGPDRPAASRMKDVGAGRELERLRRACSEFEGLFLAQIMRIMRRSGLRSDFLHAGVAEDIFVDQLDEALARSAGEGGGLGLGKLLYDQLAPLVTQTARQPGLLRGVRIQQGMQSDGATQSQ